MKQARSTTVVAITAQNEQVGTERTELVRIPRGADSTLFGGWGVRI